VAERSVPGEVRLRPGEEQSIPLPNHGAGGYRWSVDVSGDCVTASIAYDEPARPPGLGERLGQVLHVRGVHAGEGLLALEERRSWEKGSPAGALTIRVAVGDSGSGQQ
jgi:predicted secreted protein